VRSSLTIYSLVAGGPTQIGLFSLLGGARLDRDGPFDTISIFDSLLKEFKEIHSTATSSWNNSLIFYYNDATRMVVYIYIWCIHIWMCILKWFGPAVANYWLCLLSLEICSLCTSLKCIVYGVWHTSVFCNKITALLCLCFFMSFYYAACFPIIYSFAFSNSRGVKLGQA
jgi:hypothetical protein